MSVERFSRTIPASGVINLGPGNFMLLLSASASVDLRADGRGTSEGFNGVTGGLLIARVEPWSSMRIIGAAGTTCDYVVGAENIAEDDTDIRLQIATIAGTAAVAVQPLSSFTNRASVAALTAAQTALFAANTSRKRITVHVDSANAGSCYFRTAGGANNIGEAVPGVSYTFENTAALDVRNDTGSTCTFYLCEEQ